MDCTASPKMETFAATRQALGSLEQSLQCSACQQLLIEPCTLGNCDHLICKSCAEKFTGNSCPACKAPAWAKDLQVKRELGMVVRLYRRLCRLISSRPEQTPTEGSSKNFTNGISNTNKERVPAADGDRDGLDWTGEGNNDEDMDLFEDQEEEKEDGRGSGDALGYGIQTESETEPMSISDSDEQTVVNQKMGHALERNVEGSETEPMSTSESDGTETEGKAGKKKRKLLSVNMLSGSKSKQGRGTGRKRAAGDANSGTTASVYTGNGKENGATSVYDFEASPPRPKTRRMKVQVKQQTRREVNLKKLAAANKTWGAVSGKRAPSSTNGKHVSFSDDSSMKSESSSAETVDPPKGLLRGKTRSKKANETLAKVKDKRPEKQSSNHEETQLTHLKSKGGKSNAGKGDKEATNHSKKSPQVNKSSPKINPKQKGKSGKATKTSDKDGQNTGHKRQPQSAKNSNHSPDLEEDDEDEVSTTPKSSCKTSGKKRSLTGAGVTSSPNSSFSSPKNPLMKRNKQGETPLHMACIKGDVTEVQSLLEQGADPNSRDNAGWTPLHEACNHGHSTLLSLLLDHGALINAPGGFEHDSPLHDAINNNRLDVICFLRERGASLETRNIHGQTPLDLASTTKMREALMTAPLNAELQTSHDASSASPSQHLRDRPVVLLGTGLKPKEKSALQRCADLLGGRVVDDFSPDITHLVAACEEEGEGLTCLRTMKYMQAVLAGRWVVNFAWVQKSIKKRERVPEAEFEIPGTTADPDSNAATRARENLQKQFPGLFDGCHFYFSGAFNHPTPPKNELTQLIKLGGGVILNRQPKTDDDVIQSSSVVPYHAKAESALASCPYYILYDHLGRKAPLAIRARKVCTVPVYWLLDCISQFAILEPPRV